jgi:histidine ammonia-lyase
MMNELMLSGNDLTLQDVIAVAGHDNPDHADFIFVQVDDKAWPGIYESRRRIEAVLEKKAPVYGVNTGFGKLAEVAISAEDASELQVNLLRSHACAVGDPLPVATVRAMMLLRANALAKGYSGIRPETLQLLLDCLNHGIHPYVPSQGSLGASGDLAPLAHLSLLLIGEGRVHYRGEWIAGAQALKMAGLNPVKLAAKEGLALINGTQAMTGIGSLALYRAQKLANFADGVAALTMEALRGIHDVFLQELHALRPHSGQVENAGRMRAWLQGSLLTTAQGELRVQDAYSLRCIPQVHGASRQSLDHVHTVMQVELNAATDNPLVLPEIDQILSGGHFHGQPVALVMDFMKIAVAELANISERRCERLVNPMLSGMPAFLARTPGLSSGLMILQYVAASLVSENKVLAHPASVDSIPSSGNQEDHVSMGTTAARQADQIISNSARVLAIEAIAAAEAITIQGFHDRLAPATKSLFEWIRARVAPVQEDRSLGQDIEQVANDLLSLLDSCPDVVVDRL